MKTALALTILALVVACRPRTAGVSAADCAAPTGTLAADATAAGLVGPFDLTIVATDGAQAGKRASGSLSLIVADTLHYGSTDVNLDAVGALKLGDPAAAAPAAPGVKVLASPGEILLRLGSDANQAGVLRFDGGYTVLRVRELGDGAFRGVWVSGVSMDQASGYFCATRASGS